MKAKKKKIKKETTFHKEVVAVEAIIPQEKPITSNVDAGTDYFWLGCSALITAIAAVLRFAWLAIKPLHHDEGVNGFF